MIKLLGVDFETANYQRASACSVGLHLKELGSENILFSKEVMINPECEFNDMNVRIHGITEKDVCDSPCFSAVYELICSLVDDDTYIITHNASFDMSVLRLSCERYGLPYPCVKFICTLVLSRALQPDLSCFRLDYLSDYFNLGSFHHHNALEDSIKCIELFEMLFKLSGSSSVTEMLKENNISTGRMHEDSYISCACGYRSNQNKIIRKEKSTMKINSELLEGKIFVFTGTLCRYERSELPDLIAQGNGIFADNVTQKTDYLVVGDGGCSTGKHKKAEQCLSSGGKIQIIGEADFYKMLNADPVNSDDEATSSGVRINKSIESELLEAVDNAEDAIERHFAYLNLQDFYYKYREEKKYLDLCIDYCMKDINSLLDVQRAHQEKRRRKISNEKYFSCSIPAFERMIIIYSKQHDYSKAIEFCDRAIKYYHLYCCKEHAERIMSRKNKLLKRQAEQMSAK